MRTLPSFGSWFQKLASLDLFKGLKSFGSAQPQPRSQNGGFVPRDSFEGMPKAPTSGTAEVPAQPAKWKAMAKLVKQSGKYDCGPATVAMLVRAQGGGEGLSDTDLLKDVSGKLKNDKGADTARQATTARDMVKMLNENGMQAVGVGTDTSKVDEHLALGRKLVVQVNTPGLAPKHWVLVDGKDAHGNYLVKDPNGTTYTKTKPELEKMMSTWLPWKQLGGGYIAVDPNPTTKGLTPAQVARVLGNDPTTGFKTRSGGTEIAV